MTTLLLVSLLTRQEPATVQYTERALGLTFQYPREWKLTKARLFDEFEIPLEGGQKATVQLFRAAYRDSQETWQQVQAEVNRTLQRTVVRQWTEEILGAPLLLTKVAYKDQGRDMVSVTGLLYVATVEKLQFRLTSGAEQSDTAEQNWRRALMTLRTVSGELPPAEGPGQKAVVIEPPKRTTTLKPVDPSKKPVRGQVLVPWKAEGRSFNALLPLGWSLGDDGRLSNPALTGIVRFAVRPESRAAAERAHAETAREGLAEFKSVRVRRDMVARVADSGALTWMTFRDGEAEKGRMAIANWTFHFENLTWTVQYRSATPDSIAVDRRALDALAKALFVEPSS
ncbi:MAG: hypothetical protein KIS64_03855 [Fimbriimonadaceae bacterium]|nr:hypothetical protein [Fimbriimonadaceae bacterium]